MLQAEASFAKAEAMAETTKAEASAKVQAAEAAAEAASAEAAKKVHDAEEAAKEACTKLETVTYEAVELRERLRCVALMLSRAGHYHSFGGTGQDVDNVGDLLMPCICK